LTRKLSGVSLCVFVRHFSDWWGWQPAPEVAQLPSVKVDISFGVLVYEIVFGRAVRWRGKQSSCSGGGGGGAPLLIWMTGGLGADKRVIDLELCWHAEPEQTYSCAVGCS
jgi:hypothetical protein